MSSMAHVYENCLRYYANISGHNISSAHVRYVCLNLTLVVNKTNDFAGALLDLESRAPIDLAVPLMGYAAPVLSIITLFLNTLVVTILTHRRIRSPTNLILVSIAICDTFTGLLTLPEYFYTYTFEGYRSYPSMSWCIILTYVSNFTPKVLHTIALWMTALLAFHRYVGVTQLRCQSWICLYKGVVTSTIMICLVSLVCHSFQLFTVVKPITVVGKDLFTSEGLQLTDTCYQTLVLITDEEYFTYVYTWIRLAFAQVLPCLIMLMFNTCLIRVTYRSYTYRRRLITGHRLSEMSETRKTIRLSVMLLLITSFTCIFELFVDANLILNFAQIYSNRSVVDPDTTGRLLVISNFLILLSFPLNFFFMLMLNSSFRRALASCLIYRLKRKVTPQRVVTVCNGRDIDNFTLVNISQSN